MKDFTEPCENCGDYIHPQEGAQVNGKLYCFACLQGLMDDDDVPVNIYGETDE